MDQVAHPISDTFVGSYHNEANAVSNLYASIDESIFNNADYIESESNPISSVYVCRITALLDPVSVRNHILTVRAGTDLGLLAIGLVIQIRQDYVDEANQGTLIATLTQASVAHTFTEYSHTLSAYECNQITNYANLYARVVFSKV